MRIATIEAEPADPGRVRLRLRADSGLVGIAEANLPGRVRSVLARLSELAEVLTGFDPFDTGLLIDNWLVRAPGRAGDIEATAVSLVEIACRDLVGKTLGLPVYRWIGGAVRDRVAALAVGWMPVEPTADGVTRAARGVIDRGFRALALAPFGPGSAAIEPTPSALREAVRLAEMVRAAVGPGVSLRIDLDGRLRPADAGRFLRMLGRVDPVAVADPVAVEHLPISSPIPVSAGHRVNLRGDVFPLLDRRGCDSIRIDLGRCGGFTGAKVIAAIAESRGVSVALRNLAGPCSTAAAVHLAATLPNLAEVEVEVSADPASNPILVDGAFPLPDGPGLGVSD